MQFHSILDSNNFEIITGFTINNKTYTIEYDGDHYGDIQITEEEYDRLLNDQMLRQFLDIKELEDKDICVFDLGGIVISEDNDYLGQEEVAELFGIELDQEFNGSYGNG